MTVGHAYADDYNAAICKQSELDVLSSKQSSIVIKQYRRKSRRVFCMSDSRYQAFNCIIDFVLALLIINFVSSIVV